MSAMAVRPGPGRPLADRRLFLARQRIGTATVRRVLADTQSRIRAGELGAGDVVQAAVDHLPPGEPATHRVINATGVLLHSRLGGAVLSGPARAAVGAATGCVDIEFDLATGRRDRRGRPAVAALMAAVPAAEAAYLVNNNAAALMLAAAVLAPGRDLVISRADLAARYDGFRLPELLLAAGARIHPVGSAEPATVADYRAALWAGTGCILRVVTAAGPDADPGPGLAELVALGIPVIADVFSGLLGPEPALPAEPDVETALNQGAALVTTGAEKLLGGPQAGLLFGGRSVVDDVRRSALARATQADKLTLAAVEATLAHRGSPTLDAVRATVGDLRTRAASIVRRLAAAGVPAEVVATEATIGRTGGSAPLPSAAVAVRGELAGPLRHGDPAVVAHRTGDRLLLDIRSVPSDQDTALVRAVISVARAAGLAPPPADRTVRPAGGTVRRNRRR